MNSKHKLSCSYEKVGRDDRDVDHRNDTDKYRDNTDGRDDNGDYSRYDEDDWKRIQSQVFQVYLMASCQLPLLTESNLIGNCDPRRKMGMIINIGETTEINDTTVKEAEYPSWIPANHEETTNTVYDQSFCQNIYDVIEQNKQGIKVRKE